MDSFVQGNALWDLVAQSDGISKTILLILFGMSVITWAVFLGKTILFHKKKRQLRAMIKRMHRAHTPNELLVIAQQGDATFPGFFLARIITFYDALLARRNQSMQGKMSEIQALERKIMDTFDALVACEEGYLPVISTCAAVAPLLGLLGTVWGLVHSFVRIGQLQSADIATMAPGIAEALITTFAGLIVAIPALIMYNYLMVQVRSLERELIAVAQRAEYILQPTLME